MANGDASAVDKDASQTHPETGQIAKWVLSVSGGGIMVISIVVLVGAWKTPEKFDDISQRVFNALLPLLGTWVGTVLAYYFSSKNFESASQSVERMVNLTTEQKLGKLAVDKEMLRLDQITVFKIPQGKAEKDVFLKDLRPQLGGKITRLPILTDAGAVKYIIHQSGLFKFIADQALAGKAGQIDALTLEDLVKDAVIGNWVANIAFVSEQSTVAEAKATMEALPGCQDLVVTKTGRKDEPMIGWMTNVEIGRLSKA